MRTWWQPTTESYLGRVPKTLILEAVREGAGITTATRIAGMKKEAMAANAAELLKGTGWLPRWLQVPGATCPLNGRSTAADNLGIPPLPQAAE